MFKAGLDVTIDADIQAVWEAVTGCEGSAWQSGVDKIETADDGHRMAYAVNGTVTHIYIIEKRPDCLYEYKMKNRRFSGLWTGRFYALSDGSTLLRIFEEIHVRHIWDRILFMLTGAAGRRQRRYARELKAYLEKT